MGPEMYSTLLLSNGDSKIPPIRIPYDKAQNTNNQQIIQQYGHYEDMQNMNEEDESVSCESSRSVDGTRNEGEKQLKIGSVNVTPHKKQK
jgi:hypothetical protein